MERRCDLIWRRDLCHLRDRLVQQVMLTFDQGIIVSEHMLELLDACVRCSSTIVLIVESAARREL